MFVVLLKILFISETQISKVVLNLRSLINYHSEHKVHSLKRYYSRIIDIIGRIQAVQSGLQSN